MRLSRKREVVGVPKETFFNLPEEKRKKIEEAAVQEFRDHNFASSSVNRIVEASGISKGSYYQYFEDKKDLYRYILSMIADQKIAFLSPVLRNPQEMDIFSLIRELYKSGLTFGLAHPDYLEIGNKMIRDSSGIAVLEEFPDMKERSDNLFLVLLKDAVKRGEVREGLDLSLISYLLSSLNITIADYYFKVRDKETYEMDIMEEVEKLITFIRYGIGERSGIKNDQS